ncbi:hypothetical protein C2845_PM07G15110 [Panicum miliaceum]|uniref:Uncharacterized protein n=1 Tax=Panicum miliaceum TaxID=4540 RepID=A0A3L6SIR7_PANMI|nr:hypothetical protein C2845_PM07G15110 [Panicum miliaceum]
MDGGSFDIWGLQPSTNGPAHTLAAHADLDLNSQAPAAEGFPGLGLYGAFLQSDDDDLLSGRDELLPGRVRGSGIPPYRAPRAGAGDGRVGVAQPYARQLNFGGSSSAAAGRGGGNGGVFPGGSSSGAGGRRANSATAAPGRRSQHTNTAFRGGGGGQCVPHPRALRSAVRGQASGSGAPFDNGDKELEEDVEELASSGGPPKKPYLKKLQWGPPTNEDLLDQLFRGYTVDGSTSFVPGDDYCENLEQEEEEEFQATPTSSTTQMNKSNKRSFSSTTRSTCTSPVKKSKSPMVKILKDIANTYKESVAINTKQMQQRASDKAAFSVKRC